MHEPLTRHIIFNPPCSEKQKDNNELPHSVGHATLSAVDYKLSLATLPDVAQYQQQTALM